MNQRGELTDLIHSAIHVVGGDCDHAAGAVLAAGYSRPRVVETVEELDALPAGTVIRTDNTFPLEKVPNEFGTPWAYGAKLCANRSVQLPATVLYLPKETP